MTADVEENFRSEPNGPVLGRIRPGTVLALEGEEERWIQATLEGWVWTRSLQTTDRMGFDVRVSASEGENLRAGVNGTILGRLNEGTLLEEVERTEGWMRVRRTGWIWAPSVRRDPAPDEGGGAGTTEVEPPARAPEQDGRWSMSGGEGAAILSGPDGDTLALSLPGTELRVLGRQGNWARVRLEGWSWLPGDSSGAPADSAVLRDVTPDQVIREPDRYAGRVVSWELQYISRERAERFRTDFYEGEPYLLTRPEGSPEFFVYVALPPEQVGVADALTPLERIRVVGRIRTGSAALTGGPILDLLELSRTGPGGP
ncbi:MAG: hypothetical protein GWM92_12075 [Gemmatimonadetes bacterium]|nr:hypothetical protein [Gemmatimonadota bacterium]NIR79421.1 hypothetical protein [Gemmatimonadota bacterium]NIT88101.1 hypothetical protein [Gemmatimonadota bacterium]NIU31928.1 hypothetical protein [Gemmatimonadota bacterium]NIU36539.1 hypothetical protein [Gemmatimonadota bacterium]